MKKILVTGGAGYIGSFIVRALKDAGYHPVIADNLSQGHREAVSDYQLYEIDLVSEKEKLDELFANQGFEGVIHMAGFIQMGESFKNPQKYFHNNLESAMNLFDVMVKHKVSKIVFSSSAGVYGDPVNLPMTEEHPKVPTNPYGETKWQIERILYWLDQAHGVRSTSIRYFNAAGASLDGNLGEAHPAESHLIPLILTAAIGGGEFVLYGDDYDTADGTNVRDYVHVLDLVDAHILALKALFDGSGTTVYNAGVGKGYSNLEIVKQVEEVIGKFAWKIGPRRAGDAAAMYASIEKIKKELGWQPKYGLNEIIESAYKWHKSHPEGYK